MIFFKIMEFAALFVYLGECATYKIGGYFPYSGCVRFCGTTTYMYALPLEPASHPPTHLSRSSQHMGLGSLCIIAASH